jgi:eukaryotic-like serine/threonine-protein kinase
VWFVDHKTCIVTYVPGAPPDVSSTSQPAARATIGKYQLERVLGSGGMGVVWAGSDREHTRRYAIKLLRSCQDAAARAKLLERARGALTLRHPAVVPVYEVGSDGARDFVAMELVEGDCVADWLAGQPPQREVIAALLEAGGALEAAHRAGIVHRNFKLHNILRGREGRVRVTDFGLARGHMEVAAPHRLSSVAIAQGGQGGGRPPPRRQHPLLDASLSQDGVFVGTPGYMAPELLRGAAADARSDQYAFCVALWEALAGARPFSGETLEELERAVRAGPAAAPAMPEALRGVLARGLAAEPERRWPDLSTLLAALRRAASARARSVGLVAAGAVTAASLTTIALLLLRRDAASTAPDQRPAAAAPCESPERAFSTVWSDERQVRWAAAHPSPRSLQVSTQLGALRQRWTTAYGAACGQADRELARRRSGCLLELRDRAAALTAALDAAAEPDGNELGALLSSISTCEE